MDGAEITGYVERVWEEEIIAELTAYIRIPNKSPAFDPQWQSHGHMDRAVVQFERWARSQPIPGLKVEIKRLAERTPLLLMQIPGTGDTEGCVLLYGHLDKQPEMTGWRDGLGPWLPAREGDRLYGRGAADDGYAMFAALTAIAALARLKTPYPRSIVLIEACEESGSFDLPYHIEALAERIGSPSLVICLDSGCGNYEQLWCTTSLRGLVGGRLKVQILEEGVHSGDASGIVASSFRILRRLLSRLEDEESGVIGPPQFRVAIPEERLRQAEAAAEVLGDEVFAKFPFVGGAGPVARQPTELILNRTWRPALAVIGIGEAPAPADAGNVLRPATEAKLSLRLPPTCDARAASQALKDLLERDPPYGARVEFTPDWAASGWHAPECERWLAQAMDDASRRYFGKPAVFMGEGGTIPFMAMLGERFPHAQFLVTGVLGPQSNAHGPNEFLSIPMAKGVTCCVAQVIAEHFESKKK
jgi:acetylornithine deacetylase/succinyl-diaminopimelate desuccinylase-like protein